MLTLVDTSEAPRPFPAAAAVHLRAHLGSKDARGRAAWTRFVRTQGVGDLFATPHGALVVFSQFPLERIPEYHRKTFVFLAGPTPEEFRGAAPPPVHDPYTQQLRYWRKRVLHLLACDPSFDTQFVVVVPEPAEAKWAACTFPGMDAYAASMHQLTWEHIMQEQAHVVAMFCWFRWTLPGRVPGNCGPTTRFEVGFGMGKWPQRRLVVWVPDDGPLPSQSACWIKAHACLTLLTADVDVEIEIEDALATLATTPAEDAASVPFMLDAPDDAGFAKFVQLVVSECCRARRHTSHHGGGG